MSKQRKLPICWFVLVENKRADWSQSRVWLWVLVGLEHSQAVVEVDAPRTLHVKLCVMCGTLSVSVVLLTTATEVFLWL